MKKSTEKNKENIQKELKKVIKSTLSELLSEVKKGKLTIEELSEELKMNYTNKRMELTGKLF